MTVFSFRAANGLGTVFGEVTKQVTGGLVSWLALSVRFPGYVANADTMVGATAAFREGLDAWLDRPTEQEPDDDRSD